MPSSPIDIVLYDTLGQAEGDDLEDSVRDSRAAYREIGAPRRSQP
jgi:hypothetical protein